MNDDEIFDRTDGDAEAEAATDETPMAYIRPVRAEDLPVGAPKMSGELFYAVHDADGRPLAVFKDRETAVVVTRTHDFQPVSVH